MNKISLAECMFKIAEVFKTPGETRSIGEIQEHFNSMVRDEDKLSITQNMNHGMKHLGQPTVTSAIEKVAAKFDELFIKLFTDAGVTPARIAVVAGAYLSISRNLALPRFYGVDFSPVESWVRNYSAMLQNMTPSEIELHQKKIDNAEVRSPEKITEAAIEIIKNLLSQFTGSLEEWTLWLRSKDLSEEMVRLAAQVYREERG